LHQLTRPDHQRCRDIAVNPVVDAVAHSKRAATAQRDRSASGQGEIGETPRGIQGQVAAIGNRARSRPAVHCEDHAVVYRQGIAGVDRQVVERGIDIEGNRSIRGSRDHCVIGIRAGTIVRDYAK